MWLYAVLTNHVSQSVCTVMTYLGKDICIPTLIVLYANNTCLSVCSYTQYSCHKVCVYYNNSTLPLTFLLPAASSFSASQFLKTYEDEFVAVVHARQSLSRLKYKGVISEDVKTSIEHANEKDAKYLLLEHLEKNATVGTLKEYCKVAIAADAFPRMQELGRKMIKALPPEEG